MKKIDFQKHILPHIVAILIFLVTTVTFFGPVFFEDKTLEQHDILQFKASAHSAIEYRDATGQEPLWSKAMFSGMPLYLTNVHWDNQPVSYTKMFLSLGLTHPYCNIYLAFLCYYIMLLAFGVRPWIAIAGGLAFGLSSYMILGFGAGHNGRIGAIAFMPLVMAGIHLAFSNRKLLGLGVTAMGMALHLRENHLQITYYLFMIVVVYALVRLVEAIMKGTIMEYVKASLLVTVGAAIGIGSFFGQLWSVTEYTKYSIRGPSELVKPGAKAAVDGLSKEYAFQYKYGIYEPMTLLIPNFYGGSSAQYFVQDENSATYEALMQNGGQQANQLAKFTSAYWGPQSFTAGPYYAGAIIVFLFVLGMLFAEKKYVVWLVPLAVLSLMISWGDSFPSFNYWLFDHLPGYNKFRSVNFALIIILFAMPLLGLMGVEKIWSTQFDRTVKNKLLIALGIVGGLCFLLLIFAGVSDFSKEGMGQLPGWLKTALAQDRAHLFRMDAFRSLAFILAVFTVLYFQLHKHVTMIGAGLIIVLLVTIDLGSADKRYFTDESFTEAGSETFVMPTEADQAILRDQTSYRVFAYNEPFGTDARTSYFHQNIGGYHGAKMKRYQDFFDSCFAIQAQQFAQGVNQGKIDLGNFEAANMLNVKYLVFGARAREVLPNNEANGNAWFVQEIVEAKSPNEELNATGKIDTKTTAVMDVSKFKAPQIGADSTARIVLEEEKPAYLRYKASTGTNGLAVFSEIYYPKGWIAKIDGQPVDILRADYILRALAVPAGDHVIEFFFKPDAYYTGNKITMASSWIALLVMLFTLAWSLRENKKTKPAADYDNGSNQVLDNNIKK